MDDTAPSASPGRASSEAGLRIGQLSRRVGVSPDVLRAWERRYGVLRPQRSRSGQRLYTSADETRVRQMLGHIERGYSPAVAARLAARDWPAPLATAPAADIAPTGDLSGLGAELRAALLGLDEARAEDVIDRLLASYALDTVLRDAVLPFLHDLGDLWSRGAITVGQEHFATAVIAGRLHALARGWDAGVGPRAVLACPSHERHDLGLLCFALALRNRGWRVCYLGADTPAAAIDGVADAARGRPGRRRRRAGRAARRRRRRTSRRSPDGGGCASAGAARAPRWPRGSAPSALPEDPIAAADLVSAARNA